MGTIAVLREGKVIDRVALVTVADVPGAGPLRRLTHALGGVGTFLAALAVVCVIVMVAARQRSRRRERERAERRRARNRAKARAEGQIE